MLTDLITSKEDAKKDIQGAVLGLLIIIAAVIILETINPQLTKTQIFLAPAEPIDMSEVSIQKKASDCVGRYGSYAWNAVNNICNPGQDTVNKEYGLLERELSCTDASGNPDGCAYARSLCESKGRTPSPSYSLTGVVQDWRIICTPQYVIAECKDGGGTWNVDKALCE